MSAHDWMVVALILGAAFLVSGALLTVVLLAVSASAGDRVTTEDADYDDLAKAYLACAEQLLRAEQTSAALREDNANLEATVTHLRRQLIRAVDDQPVPLLPTEAAEKAAFDAIVRGWDGA